MNKCLCLPLLSQIIQKGNSHSDKRQRLAQIFLNWLYDSSNYGVKWIQNDICLVDFNRVKEKEVERQMMD